MSEKIEAAYATWGTPEEFSRASKVANKAIQAAMPIYRSTGALANRFQNIDGSTSVRDAVSRLDYEFFRPNEQMPKRFRDIIVSCNGAYQKVALVRQIIDLMGDFCANGINLYHPNKSIERFYQEWFKHVNGGERSERIANLLYRTGNVVIKRNTAEINEKIAVDWKRSKAADGEIKTDVDMKDHPETGKKEIAVRYTMLNPVVLEVVGEEMAAFTGKTHYLLKLPMNFYRSLNIPLATFDPAILTEDMPQDIQGAIDNHDRYLALDPDKLITCYYKKDDWDVWAYPMLYSILDDLMLFQKMKLADLTALDGVISHIRIWKLGSLEHKILPTDAAVNKLAGILLNHMAGGAIDLIWGPDLSIEETSTDVYKFLGGEKYEAVMAHIHSGLGIPSSMSGGGGSFSDNFLSLRTLIQRLQYGRDVLTKFWEGEIKLLQKAMGFRYPAQVTFSNINLHDESTEKALWIQLIDRGLVTRQSVQEKFGLLPDIEEARLRREVDEHPIKIGPYTDGQPELSMLKIFAQKGTITPSEVGIELEEKKAGEQNAITMQGKLALQAKKQAGISGEGRPPMSKDSKPRKQRVTKPRSTADIEYSDAQEFMHLVLYANQLQKCIADIVNPFYLEKFQKKNLRQLNAVEEKELESFKFALLFNCAIDSSGTEEENVLAALSQPIIVYNHIEETYNKLIAKYTEMKKEKNGIDAVFPTYEEMKQMRNYIYATFKGEY